MIESEEDRSRLLQLYEAKKEISNVLYKHRKLLSSLTDEEIKRHRGTADDVLKMAENVTETSYAPPGWRPGAPLINAHPPAPQVEQMRLGLLGALGIQMGLTSVQQDKQSSLLREASITSGDGQENVQDSIAMMIKEKDEDDKGKDNEIDVNNMEIEVNSKEEVKEEVTVDPVKDMSIRPAVNHDRFARSAPRAAAASTKKVIDMNMGFSDSDSEDSDEN